MTFEPHCINSSLTIKDALVALNNLRNATLTLFVLNDNAQIIGTLTDGDIRRALVNGHGLDCTLDKVMHRDYKSSVKGVYCSKFALIPRSSHHVHPNSRWRVSVVDVVDLQKFKSKLPIDAVLDGRWQGRHAFVRLLRRPQSLFSK